MIETELNLKCGASCKKRSSLMHQNDSKGVEYGHRMGQILKTNMNTMKYA
jgi:hypothetical protein